MEYIFEPVKIKIQDMSPDGKQIRQFEKVNKIEYDFLKDLSKEKQYEYRKL